MSKQMKNLTQDKKQVKAPRNNDLFAEMNAYEEYNRTCEDLLNSYDTKNQSQLKKILPKPVIDFMDVSNKSNPPDSNNRVRILNSNTCEMNIYKMTGTNKLYKLF
jgi:hypothetical protein